VPHLNTKYDWYQNGTHIFLTFKVIGDKELAKRINVEFNTREVILTWDGEGLVIPLSNDIDAAHC